MPDRIVGNYIILSSIRAGQPLVLPEHTNPFTGEQIAAVTLYDGQPLIQAVPLLTSVDGQRIMLRGLWDGEELFGLAMLSHADGTGSTVLSYEQALALLETPEWKAVISDGE